MADLELPQPENQQPLLPLHYRLAAEVLGCEARVIEAVVGVESPRGPFDENGRPTLLFERHKFHIFTGGKFDMVAPDLSSATPGGYGKYSEQYERLRRAYFLSADDAIMATSWGSFQILGENYKAAGYDTPRAFAEAMCRSAEEQLNAFVRFIAADKNLSAAVKAKDWPTFARHYNGPTYRQNRYDEKLSVAYLEEQ